MPDDPKPPADDKFRPDAIAARIEKIGAETDAERLAREEEQKLLARKQDRGKTGLEAAASKRLSKIGEGTVKRPSAVAASAIPDAAPLLDRAARLNRWIDAHRVGVGLAGGAVVLAVAAALGTTYWQGKRTAEASVVLARALADDHGHVTATKDDDSDEAATKQLYPTFKSEAERRDATLAKYRDVETKFPGTGAAIVARLGEASLLLDKGDTNGARAGYEDVKKSPLAQVDSEVRGRALEGIGFVDEHLAASDAAARDKHLDDALADFKALEGVDVEGFKELAKYHQARVLLAKGDKAKAVELLKDVHTRIGESTASKAYSYLQFVVEDRLRELDPSALPPKPNMAGGLGGAGGANMNDPKIQELLRQLQQGKLGGGSAPGAPVPAPPAGATP